MKALKVIGIAIGLLLVVSAAFFATGYGAKLVGSAFVLYNKPSGDFDSASAVAKPDYRDAANWAALPMKRDPSDLVPVGIEAATEGKNPVDTFFIHPTGFLTNGGWTSPMDPDSGTEENTKWMMANQASAYNGCCNVYAPRYREANIFAYFSSTPEYRDEVLAFSYEDVKSAFEFYLTNYNEGRPFIIASHSQGTHHAIRLLRDVIDNSELHERMVAAYMIGGAIVPVSPDWFDSMANIAPCQSPEDLHCVVHWDTMPEGGEPMERAAPSLCTNPLSWRVDEELAVADLNEGAVVPEGTYNITFGRNADTATDQNFEKLGAPARGQTWAQCKDGSLFARDQKGTAFSAMGSDDMGTYHGLDYALFYMNIRNNAILRANVYMARDSIIDAGIEGE